MNITEEANITTCTEGQVFKYIYHNDIVYEFYTDSVLQSIEMLVLVQESVDSAGSMTAYIEITFRNDTCIQSTYNASK